MATFDYKSYLSLVGGGGDPLDALGMSYGVPRCMMELTKGALSLIPMPILGKIRNKVKEGRKMGENAVAGMFNKVLQEFGLMEWDTEEGVFKFISDSSEHGMDENESSLLDALEAFGEIVAIGAGAYKTISDIGKELERIKDCFAGFKEAMEFQSGMSARKKSDPNFDPNAAYGAAIQGIKDGQDFIDEADGLLDLIDEVIEERRISPSKEPLFNAKYCKLPKSNLSLPDLDFKCEGEGEEDEGEEVIRLVFGPPNSIKGKFLLSVDGLYYDSQTSGLPEWYKDKDLSGLTKDEPGGLQLVLTEIIRRQKSLIDEDRWRFEQDPNLGGKGQQISSKDIDDYVDTLFDPNIIDDSDNIKRYYDVDHFLQTLIGQKEKHIYDLSADLQELTDGGASVAIIYNTRQSILAEISQHNLRINKRKKQIEIAAKAKSIYGAKVILPGKVPINDFSYLGDVNFAVQIDKQRNLILDTGDVSGSVLPLKPKFVINPGNQSHTEIDHLLVPGVGVGQILATASSVSATSGTTLGVNEGITTRGLMAVYNYLKTAVTQPSSNIFSVLNCATEDYYNNAQLVAPNSSSVFFSGLGIPYLEGITKLNEYDSSISGLGSYIRLPDTSSFQMFTYGDKGFTFETWAHLPYLSNSSVGWHGGTDASSLYRLLLSCENTGVASSIVDAGKVQPNIDRLNPDFDGNTIVRGMMVGFTCDRRISLVEDSTNDVGYHNEPASSLSFFIAPTQSKDSSSIGLLSRVGCASGQGWHSFAVDASTVGPKGVKFSDACSSFVHIAVSVDILNNNVKAYLDGNLMGTSSLYSVFGVEDYTPIRLPSFRMENSFEYNISSVNTSAPFSLKHGPQLRFYENNKWRPSAFTPWILGGGWTDGMVRDPDTEVLAGNFMGYNQGGRTSGLKGHMGSTKFYDRPLVAGEIEKNYKSQKVFFKNIRTTNNCRGDA